MKAVLPIALSLFSILRSLIAQPSVAIQPLGEVDPLILIETKAGIERLYNLKAEVLPKVPLPSSAYYPARQRYRADRLLDYLDSLREPHYIKIVGLTTADISTTKGEFYDWGVFGLGTLGGTACVVSTFRLGRGKVSGTKRLERLVKVVNHELGHTLGLDHCPNRGCLMEDAQGTIKTVDRESGRLCDSCRIKISKYVRQSTRPQRSQRKSEPSD